MKPSVPVVRLDPVEEALFWSHVDKSGECWVWTANRARGYGRVKVRRLSVSAHRLAWVLAFGPIPDGLLVLHRCDNPPCVNPDHLWLGTHGDNQRDKWAKGRGLTPEQFAAIRHPKGDDHPRRRHPELWPMHSHPKLTEDQVRSIRDEYAAGGVTQQALADRYRVRQTLISRIVLRQIWRASSRGDGPRCEDIPAHVGDFVAPRPGLEQRTRREPPYVP